MGGQPLAQRLRDKRHDWEDLKLLIPGIIAQGLMGYQFTCPDMIGGGEYGSFINLETIDEELIVRSAQCSVLMPMMQFSVAPWRILSKQNLKICREMAELHKKFGDEILKLAKESAITGEPIVRN
ncbi:MAG TPA: TIM-barrel domain-containing protein, partial [Ignavibacteriaceae bacterium]|nr:TIM-barrel domain-containing protein [Ignavibacteriaceae bacterium]